jgi:hypothetical protein
VQHLRASLLDHLPAACPAEAETRDRTGFMMRLDEDDPDEDVDEDEDEDEEEEETWQVSCSDLR